MTEEAAEQSTEQAETAASPDGELSEEPTVESLKREAEENWSKYLRAAAELDNLRKRNARELENARKYSIERFAAALLPVRDSIEAALAASDTADVAALLEGERATLRLLDEALDSADIKEIDPHGEPFDPSKQEAISMLPSDSAEPGTVLEVSQKGYEVHERLLRPARVVVARAPAEEQD